MAPLSPSIATHHSERGPVPARRGPARPPDPSTPSSGRVLGRYHTIFTRAGAQLDRMPKAPCCDHERLARLGPQFSQNVLADEKDYALVSTRRGPCGRLIPARRGGADCGDAATRQARRHPVALEHRAFLQFRRAAICASEAFAPGTGRGERGGATDTRPSSRDGGAACRRAPLSAFRPSPISSCTT